MAGKIRYTKEEVLKQMQDHYKRNGKITTESFSMDKEVCSVKTVEAKFGSWVKGLIKAGLREEKYIEYDKEKLLILLREKVKNGEIKYKKDIIKIPGVPSKTYIDKLWSWDELSGLLNLKKKERTYTKEMIISKHRKLKEEEKYINKRISSETFYKEAGVNVVSVRRLFGSWNNFCSLVDNKDWKVFKINYTDEELLKLYMELSIKIGKGDSGATAEDIQKEFPFSYQVFGTRFKGLNNLRKILKLKIKHPKEFIYTKKIITQMLYKKYKEYGKRLTALELKEIREEHKKNAKEPFPAESTILSHFRATGLSEVWDEILKEQKGKEEWKRVKL